ncbi:MAG: GntR family transcriptional regulator [Proteobacteria bacterium]|nr:MAG: GntR family transcriptional regulator [Pseudomonadota bacterium]PIE65244.1 MAG: GntR family transcriptional regulator [Desulfobacterales bacterium]
MPQVFHKKLTSETAVYERLKSAIRKRYIKQGSRLIETVLAGQLGVSRTPIRSAIKRLESEGLVQTSVNRGAHVITPTREEIEHTFEVRTALECLAVEQAIKNVTPEKITELQKLIDNEHTILAEKRMPEYWENNNAIHLKIAEMSGNLVLVAYIRELLDRSSLYLVLYDPFSRLEYSPLAEHEKIYAALAAASREEARTAMKEHLKSSTVYMHLAEDVPEDYISLT